MGDIMLVNGDILDSVFSDIALSIDGNEIVQTASDNIQTIYGENPFHTDIGNKAFTYRTKITENDLIMVANDCKAAIMQDSRITDAVVTVTQIKEGSTECEVSFSLITTDGEVLNSAVNIMG